MLKRIEIPKDLWFFVGRVLVSIGCINENMLKSSVFNEPKIRWLLLENKDWKNYCSNIDLSSNLYEGTNNRPAETEYLVNLFIKESIKREKRSEKFSERKRMIVERGFIEFDNVILMHESQTKEIFIEANEKCINQLQTPLFLSIDALLLELFIRELINIYKFRLGECFACEQGTEFNLESEILLAYLKVHSLSPKDFKLKIRYIPKEEELNEIELRKNIWKALIEKKPRILKDENGKTIAEFNVGKLFKLDKQTIHVDFGSIGLKTRKNLVGLGHILYNPEIFGASNTQEVVDSWNWVINKIKVSEEALQMALEACSLSMLLLTGVEEGTDISIFSLFVNLHKLDSLGIDTKTKIVEFGRLIKGHVRNFGKFENTNIWRSLLITQKLRKHLSNLSSECLLALLAKSYGYTVRLEKNPDLKIADKGVEVKRANSRNLSSAIDSAKKQPHDIIAIEVDTLDEIEIPYYTAPAYESTWLRVGNLRDVLDTALDIRYDGDVILLFMVTFEGLKGRIMLLKENS